jgi:hypothetical protein
MTCDNAQLGFDRLDKLRVIFSVEMPVGMFVEFIPALIGLI